jgi:propionyl-CoA carboxylase alpha chain
MADSHGNILYLFERECSISAAIKGSGRSTSSVLLNYAREMGEAVLVAKSCDYLGGTVEFY